jgi:hypothetical protein
MAALCTWWKTKTLVRNFGSCFLHNTKRNMAAMASVATQSLLYWSDN